MIVEETVSYGSRIADAGCFDYDAVDFVIRGELLDLLHECFLKSAADTAVGHLDHLGLSLDHAVLIDDRCIDVDAADIVNNYRELLPGLTLQQFIQHSSFART